jgi:serine/threonine protein kinase
MPGLSPDSIFAGRYKLVQLLGIGGYSEVWKAIDNMAGEMPVALKIFAPGKGLDHNGIKIFSSEYSLVFNLSHPGLLQAKHYDIWEGSPYLVMTFCVNGSVFGKIGEMSEIEVLRFIQQAADALDYLHSQLTPIIHQDIKPDNFLINESGNYLLSDFGISSRLRRTLTRSVGNEGSAGTMAYLPPERFSQNKQVLPAGDIFALGVTVYELLSGDLPFDDQGGLRLKNGADIPDLPHIFSPDLNALVRSCLNLNPDSRPDASSLKRKADELSETIRTGSSSPSQEKKLVQARKTEKIPDIAPPVITEIDTPNNTIRNYLLPIIILVLIVGFGFMLFLNNSRKSLEEKNAKALTDSITLSDSLANVAAEQARIADSTLSAMAQIVDSKQIVLNESVGESSQGKRILGQKDNTNKPQTEAPITKTGFSIGQQFGGGIIFFIDGTRNHGLIAATSDQSTNVNWGCIDTQIKGTSSAIGSGQANTNAIVNKCRFSSSAAILCDELIRKGMNDWFLPSKDELGIMYQQKNVIGGFTEGIYWSSTPHYNNLAWLQSFSSGYKDSGLRSGLFCVRAIRAF